CNTDTVIVHAPDMIATKTNNVSGTAYVGQTWTWSIRVDNIGDDAAQYTDPGLDFLLQDSPLPTNVVYGSPVLSDFVGVTDLQTGGSATFGCALAINQLYCKTNGQRIRIAVGGGFTVSFTATASAPGTYKNPSSGDVCRASFPTNADGNQSNNKCTDTVEVIPATASPSPTPTATPTPTETPTPTPTETSNGSINAGDAAEFDIFTANVGAATATNVVMTDNLPVIDNLAVWSIDPSKTDAVSLAACTMAPLTGPGPQTLTCNYGAFAA